VRLSGLASGLTLAVRPAGLAEAPGSSVTSRVRLTTHLPPVLVARRSQSGLRLEGRTRTLSGPSLDMSPARTL
jgi:hypothetical protein